MKYFSIEPFLGLFHVVDANCCFGLIQSHVLPLSLAEMNARLFTPRKDYSTNRLHAGLLQLSAGTHLIIDETAMQPGQLNSSG